MWIVHWCFEPSQPQGICGIKYFVSVPELSRPPPHQISLLVALCAFVKQKKMVRRWVNWWCVGFSGSKREVLASFVWISTWRGWMLEGYMDLVLIQCTHQMFNKQYYWIRTKLPKIEESQLLLFFKRLIYLTILNKLRNFCFSILA